MLNLLQVEFHHKNAWSTCHYVCTVLKPRFKIHLTIWQKLSLSGYSVVGVATHLTNHS